MAPSHHNPGRPITLNLGEDVLTAFSVAALSTYVLVPRMSLAFDMGDCPMDAVPLERVFLSHAHGDHARCLLRHESLRRLMDMQPATYYIPRETLAGFEALAKAWRLLEQVGEGRGKNPRFVALGPGDEVWLNKQLAVRAFRADHALPSLGYTVFDVRKKLKPEYHGLSGPELGALRRKGEAFEEVLWLPRITYIGDCSIDTLQRETHVFASRILLIEVTYLLEEERAMARQRGHTHLDDLLDLLERQPGLLQNEHLILKHFSMRYDKKLILKILDQRLPPELKERVHVLV